MKGAHHRGTYHMASMRVRAMAYANPNTRCWRCQRTLAEIRRTKPKAIWTAGHILDGVPESPLLAECSPCNYGAGARLGNSRKRPGLNVSRRW
jgi:hypothetical protein